MTTFLFSRLVSVPNISNFLRNIRIDLTKIAQVMILSSNRHEIALPIKFKYIVDDIHAALPSEKSNSATSQHPNTTILNQ